MSEHRVKMSVRLIGGVVRGPPPLICCLAKFLCPIRAEGKCGQCSRREIRSVSISFGGEPSLESAIKKGLTTREEIERFYQKITGEIR